MRIVIFEDDASLAHMTETALSIKGHDVKSYFDPTACPIYKDHKVLCQSKRPCADVIISDYTMPNMTGVDFFKLQRSRGCKALDANKMILSGKALTPEELSDIQSLGIKYIKKPYRMTELYDWIEGCAERLGIDH